jgi:hypothetical protein
MLCLLAVVLLLLRGLFSSLLMMRLLVVMGHGRWPVAHQTVRQKTD